MRRFLTTAAEIREAVPKFKVKAIDVPEWGEDIAVYVRELSAYRRDKYDQVAQEKKYENARAVWVAMVLCDENGVPTYKDDVAGAKELGAKPASGIDRIFDESRKLSLANKDQTDDLKKNCETTGDTSDSNSPSVSPSENGTSIVSST